MALTSKNMYDTFKDELWKELGPLDPSWFEVLTVQTLVNEGNVSDHDELCANQEGNFKSPLDKTAVDSQLFSTPKVFRHNRIVSPETEDEQSFTAAQDKSTLPWPETQSPYLFQMSKQGVPSAKYGQIQSQSQDSFDLLDTPRKSPFCYVKHISESLGAQMNTDISWTSSLNTPPVVPSTLILSKIDESPCPVSASADQNVVIVRKLFPSLSNAGVAGVASPNNDDMPAVNHGAVSLKAVSPQTSLIQSEGVWQQMQPDAIKDGEVCSPGFGVPDEPENVSSAFLANSSLALRKVKPDRIRRKQIIQTKEHGCSSTNIPTTSTSYEEGKVDKELNALPPSPTVKTGITEISQWSPLSLSEIPPCAMDNNILTELQTDSDSGQFVRPPINMTGSGFIKKKRKFIYTVGTLKPQLQANETHSQKVDTSPRITDSGPEVIMKDLENAPDEADCCSIKKNTEQKEENLPSSVQTEVQDLDMSQLHKDFAEDFSQISESSNGVAEDTQRYFSPSACLSAVKQVKQKTRQADLHNIGLMSTTNQNYSINEGTTRDSGFQSAVADVTNMPASSFVLPCSENAESKTDIHRTTPFPSINKGNIKSQLEERPTLDTERESQLQMESTLRNLPSSPKGTVDNINCITLSGQINGSLPEKTAGSLPSVHVSRFKTASNKLIQISSVNLQRAKRLFEETDREMTLSDQSTKHQINLNNGTVKSTVSVSNQLPTLSERFKDASCQLTASQKADVVELCTLLEEADSQFEFTQFKTEKLKQHCQNSACSPQKADKDLDPDFLAGIDFDDSFSSDAEKHLVVTVMPDKMTSVLNEKTNSETSDITSEFTSALMSNTIKRKNSSAGDVLYSSENIPEGSNCLMSTKPKSLQRAEHTETNKTEKQNPLMLSVAFKTAGGNVLKVSKTCLNKAKALFAALEVNLSDPNSPDKQTAEIDAKSEKASSAKDDFKFSLKDDCHAKEKILGCFSNKRVTNMQDEDDAKSFENSRTDTTACQSGPRVADGKGIFSSAKHTQQADPVFKDSDEMEHDDGRKHPLVIQDNISDESANLHSKFENVNAGLGGSYLDDVEMNSVGGNNMLASFLETTYSTSKLLPCSPSEIIDSSAISEFRSSDGFCTASGKKVSVSADAVERAKCLLNEIHTHEDTGKKPNQKENALGAQQLTAQSKVSPPKKSQFQTARGKGVPISSAALKKAKYLLNECNEVQDKINAKESHSKIPVHGPPPSIGGFLAASGKKITLSSEALQKGKALFSDISFSAEIPVVPHTRNSDEKHDNCENTNKMKFGFTVGEEKVCVSQKNSVLTKALINCDMDVNAVSVKHESIAPMSASGSEKKKLSEIRPDQRVTVNISVESENGGTEFTNKQKEDILTLQNGGFQTASGKGVTISSEALKKAKSLLGECDEMEDKIKVNPSHSKIPVHNPLPKNGGFLAVIGKPATLSSEALQKAKALFSDISFSAEIPRNSDKHDKMQCGFTTAGGGRVHVLKKNLLKAKHILSEFDDSLLTKKMQDVDGFAKDYNKDVKNEMSVKHESIAPVSGSESEKKKVLGLQTDQRMAVKNSVESRDGFTEGTSELVKQNNESLPLQNGGFQTASGKGVTISSEALKKAKSLLGECDEVKDKTNIKSSCSESHCLGSLPKNGGFLAASGKPVALSFEALQRAKALFSDISFSAEIPHAKKSDNKNDNGENTEKMHRGFKTVGGENVHLSRKNLLKTKHLLKEFDDSDSTKVMQTADGFDRDCIMDISSEMPVRYDRKAPASGISEESGIEYTEDTNKQVKQKNSFPQQSAGFQTASGKGVAISSEALKRAKTLLSQCEGVEDKISVNPPHSKISVHGPPFRNSGFHAASGKPVVLSSEAMQKAKALFSDISLSTDSLDVSVMKKLDAQSKQEKINYGSTVAGGAKVHVSEKSLLKSKYRLKECGEVHCQDSHLYSTSPQDNCKLNLSKVKDVEGTSDSNLATTSDKDMPLKGSVPLVIKSLTSLQESDYESEAIESGRGCSSIINQSPEDPFKFQEDKITPSGAGNLHDCLEKQMPCVLDHEINEASSTKKPKVLKVEESSVLNFQSLNLTGCSETQQKFLAQEALDCTKALLEDEGLADQSLSMTLENMPQQDNTKSSNGHKEVEERRGKRSVEDPEMTGQPPLKRRLLEEFDRTVIDPKASNLHPVKSSPNGVMKDRRVFKYSASLHPNVTWPNSNGKNYVETRFQKTTHTQHSTPGDSRSAHSKMSAFVPPFVKNSKAETHNNVVLKDTKRIPSAFVPPFKKQKTIVQESSSKPQEGEDKHHQPFAMLSDSNCFVPPTKKTQAAADVTVLTDTPINDMKNSHNLPVDCGSVSSAEEASDVYQNLQNTELARDMQDMRIRKKKRQNIRPLPGSLFLTKTSGVARIPLKVAMNGKTPGRYTQKELYGYGVQKQVSDITSENAESFRFNLLQFIKQEAFRDGGGVQLADGGWLIPSNDGTAGKEEFYRALCDTPGVDPKLITDAWVYNHYRWIVWKQASMEKSFPEKVGSLCLTPEQVLLQLKYRYDVEVDHSRRPALRRIMEKDDTAVKTLVLCICEIVSRGHSPKRQTHSDTKSPHSADAKVENPSALVWLTDGWYAIKAQLDEPLTAMLHKGRLTVGGKLIIHGAQLVGSQDACSPLEAPDSLMLKICANSSRPARWDAKLGFHKDPRPFLLPISCLYSNGGPVGCADIVILRSYPIQWMERKPDGGVVFRSSRAEEKEARRYNSHKQKAMEILFSRIQAEFEKEEKGNIKPQRRRKTISYQDIASLQDGEELYEAVGDDLAYFEAHLSKHQLETLNTFRRSLMDKKQAELQDRYHRALETEGNKMSCPKREVTPVWRLRIADSVEQPSRVYQLNLWRPSSDLQSLLKEGCRYKVYNLTTSDTKKRSTVETLQLTGTKKTQFQELQASQEWLSAYFHPRVSTNFVNLQNPDFQPLCGEVDLAGYVVSVIDGQGSSPAFYLADENFNFVKVRCFSSLAHSGLEDVVKPCVLLALSNLQLRGQSIHPTPVVYAGDLTNFSTNPKEAHLQESLSQLKKLVQCQENFFVTAEEKLSHLVNSNGLSCLSSPALQTQTPASTTDRKQEPKTSKPVRSLGFFTPVSRNPPAPTSSAEKDPKSLKRRRALEYLSRIPSPPPLSHLGSVASQGVNKTFNPPRRSGTPSTLKTIQTPAHLPTESLREDEWVNDEELAMIDTQALY